MCHNDQVVFYYKHITDRLPDSLVKRAYQSLLIHSKNPVPLEMISGKSGRIESYLRYTWNRNYFDFCNFDSRNSRNIVEIIRLLSPKSRNSRNYTKVMWFTYYNNIIKIQNLRSSYSVIRFRWSLRHSIRLIERILMICILCL